MSQERKYSDEFRAEALRKMENGANVSALARELGVGRRALYKWQNLAKAGVEASLTAEQRDRKKVEQRNAELERLVGRLTAEVDFFKGALRKVEERRQNSGRTGGAASTSK